MTPEEVAGKASVSRLHAYERDRKSKPSKRVRKDAELREIAAVVPFERARLQLFQLPNDEKTQNDLGNALIEWADIESSRLIDTFALQHHISPQRLYKLGEKNDYFAACLEYALAKLGERMEMKVKDHPLYIAKALPLYSTKFIEAENKKLAAVSASATSVQTYIPIFYDKDNKPSKP